MLDLDLLCGRKRNFKGILMLTSECVIRVLIGNIVLSSSSGDNMLCLQVATLYAHGKKEIN